MSSPAAYFRADVEDVSTISRQLTEQENLSLGDALTCTAYGRECTVTVTGIYETDAVCQVTEDNPGGTGVFAYSPYNRIYTDLDTAAALFGFAPETIWIDFYVDSPSHVQQVGQAMKALALNWSVYRLVNTTQTTYNSEAGAIESALATTELLVSALSVFSVLVIVLVTCLWAGRSWYESGIFLALGASKWYALAQQLLAAVLVAIPAMLLTLLLAQPVASLLLQGITDLNQSGAMSGGEFSALNTGTEHDFTVTLVMPGMQVYAAFAGRCALAVLCACLLPGYCVLRLKPREILSRK